MAEEYLYGATLDSNQTSEVWDPTPKNDDSESHQPFDVDQKLIIKMALLGAEAKPGEINVVQVEAMGLKAPIKIPIAILEMGKTAQVALDLSFPDPPVTFSLISGNGPVHIVGHNLLATHIDEFEEMEDEDVEVDAFEEDDDEKDPEDTDFEDDEPKKKKMKGGAPQKSKNSKPQNSTGANQNQKKK